MGRIVDEVISGQLNTRPEEEDFLKAFLPCFEITWGARRRAFGSDLSVYLMCPEPHMERAFGFESEILAVYSSYSELQPRTIQAIEKFLSDDPARGRVDTMIAFLISEAPDPLSWARQYMTSNPESRLIAAFQAQSLRDNNDDPWLIRSQLARQLYQRDLFDYRLPLNNDYFFFGREDLLFDLYNAFKRSENRGLFGLRKTGKTSVFFKLERRILAAADGLFLYFDCKYPPLRALHWEGLLLRIATDLAAKASEEKPPDNVHAADAFLTVVERVCTTRQVALVFDEIEYISPQSPLDQHWKDDFIPFWQTIWAAQSRFRNLAVLVGGVNPGIVEKDMIGGVQNPLFGIVPHQYLGGLRPDEVRRMLRTLGRPMGLKFNLDAVDYLIHRFGGHPLLTRLACSLIHRAVRDSGVDLPKTVDAVTLRESEGQREAELSFYCGHVVSELQLFYPDEYDLLKQVSIGNLADVFEFTSEPAFTTHLLNYGLLFRDSVGRPGISIPILERYIGIESARSDGRKTILDVVPAPRRTEWLRTRIETINANLDRLQAGIERAQRPFIFGPHSYPESHKFFSLKVVSDEREFSQFINVCNRCFVEAIERYGASVGKDKYFWSEINTAYPALGQAFRRIKVYRHNRVHIRLNPSTDAELEFFLSKDLEGRTPSSISDLWFQLQQCVLDDLLVAILVEIDRLV